MESLSPPDPTGPGGEHRMPAVNDVGEPCAGEPHARFDGRALETEQPGRALRFPGRWPTTPPRRPGREPPCRPTATAPALDPTPAQERPHRPHSRSADWGAASQGLHDNEADRQLRAHEGLCMTMTRCRERGGVAFRSRRLTPLASEAIANVGASCVSPCQVTRRRVLRRGPRWQRWPVAERRDARAGRIGGRKSRGAAFKSLVYELG